MELGAVAIGTRKIDSVETKTAGLLGPYLGVQLERGNSNHGVCELGIMLLSNQTETNVAVGGLHDRMGGWAPCRGRYG